MKLLLVEDEKRMADALKELLVQEKYDVDVCCDGISGEDALLSGAYDGAVLDVMLPGKNGFDIVRAARKAGIDTAVIMLTARSSTEDKVTGLDGGADDYLTKPFRPEELLARLRALLRRNSPGRDDRLRFGDVYLERGTAMLFCEKTEQSVRLSEKELRLLECMMANGKQIVPREQLAVKIWGYESESEYNNVEVYLSFTRKKLAFIGSEVEIKAVRGIGYELRRRNV